MNSKQMLILAVALFYGELLYAQKSSVKSNYLDVPIVLDSVPVVMIPVRYMASLSTSDKLALWGDVFSNIIFYNHEADTMHRLFTQDTYIMNFNSSKSYPYLNRAQPFFTGKYILYRVKNNDHNGNGRIDNKDPAVLYVSDLYGRNLNAVTTPNEHVIDFDLNVQKNFALLKIRTDSDHNGVFDEYDSDVYYQRLDLNTMQLGQKIKPVN